MKKLLIATALTLCSHAVLADVAVIVNPANSSAIDEGMIKKITLVRQSRLMMAQK